MQLCLLFERRQVFCLLLDRSLRYTQRELQSH